MIKKALVLAAGVLPFISTSQEVINFQDRAILSYAGGQDVNGCATLEDEGNTLHLSGNVWKCIELPYNLTEDSVLVFDFQSDNQGEEHAIGLDENRSITNAYRFNLYGQQGVGETITDFKTYATDAPNTVRYAIPIGKYFTGQKSYLFFTNDHDVAEPTGECRFSNVRLFELATGGGLTDAELVSLGLLPADEDYDNDGVSNADEVASGTDAKRFNMALEAGWVSTDIGVTGLEGRVERFENSYEISASGSDIYNSSDSFHYLCTEQDGDFEITVKVDSQTRTHGWAKTGLMVRATLDDNAANTMLALSPDHGLILSQRKSESEITTISTRMTEVKAPAWMKIQRIDSTLKTFASSDGELWYETGSVSNNPVCSGNVFVGLAVSAHTNSELSKSVFSNLSCGDVVDNDGDGIDNMSEMLVYNTDPDDADRDGDKISDYDEIFVENTDPNRTNLALEEGWATTDIGETAIEGRVVHYDNTYEISGSGWDIYEKSDAFRYLYTELDGDFEITVKVDSQSRSHEWAKTGLMLRSSVEPNAGNIMVAVSPDKE